MNVIVSNSSDVPLYMQIKEQIKDAILKGELEDGELLPFGTLQTIFRLAS